MNKQLLFALAGVCMFSAAQAQTLIYSENFNSAHTFTLNSTDLGSAMGTSGTNAWYVNNDYTGAPNGSIICGGPIPISYPDNNQQPGGITGSPNSPYLHVASFSGYSFGATNSSVMLADGSCVPAESNFAKMTNDISTIGYTNVTLGFWWQGIGAGNNAYGQVYYSTNSGANWTQVGTNLNNNGNWTLVTTTNAAFDNKATLRFGFRFNNQVSSLTSVVGFAIDDIGVLGFSSSTSVTQDPSNVTACDGDTVTFSITASNASSYQWQVNTGMGYNNVSNGGNYQGATTSTLTVYSNTGMNGNLYRCYINGSGSDTSTAATLSMISAPVFTITSNPASPVVNQSATFATSPALNNVTYNWTFCGGAQNSTADSAVVTFTAANVYTNCPCLEITAQNGCKRTVCTPSLTVVNNASVENYNTSSFSLYPNPTGEMLFFQEAEEFTGGSIIDAEGRMVIQINATDLSAGMISVRHLPSGIYTVSLTDKNFVNVYRKLIIE